MSKTVTFGMHWECYGRQTIDLPDNIDCTDIDAVKAYIKSVWADVPIPDGEYVQDSDDFDEESMLNIVTTDDPEIEKHIAFCNGSLPMGVYRALLDCLDENYHISLYDEEGIEKGIELESWTDGGVDMLRLIDFRDNLDFRCSPYEFVRLFRKLADEFDVDEEIDCHRQDERYCDAFTHSQSLRDFSEYQAELNDYANALEEILEQAEMRGLNQNLCEGVFFSIEDLIDGLGEEVRK